MKVSCPGSSSCLISACSRFHELNVMHCELISWGEVERLCRQLAQQIRASGFAPDLVIAIGRGGYVPARLLCDYLDIMALTSIKIEHYLAGSNKQPEAVIRFPLCSDIRGQRVLLVDDVNDSGDTLALARQHLLESSPQTVRTAVMHQKTSTCFSVDYYARKIVKWRWLIYPWAITEDIGHFLQQLSPAPASLAEARQRLYDEYRIRLSLRQLKMVYAMLPD